MNIFDIRRAVEKEELTFFVDSFNEGLTYQPVICVKDNKTNEMLRLTYMQAEEVPKTLFYDEREFSDEAKKTLRLVICMDYNGEKVYFKDLKADDLKKSDNQDGKISFVTDPRKAIGYSAIRSYAHVQIGCIKYSLDKNHPYNKGLSNPCHLYTSPSPRDRG